MLAMISKWIVSIALVVMWVEKILTSRWTNYDAWNQLITQAMDRIIPWAEWSDN